MTRQFSYSEASVTNFASSFGKNIWNKRTLASHSNGSFHQIHKGNPYNIIVYLLRIAKYNFVFRVTNHLQSCCKFQYLPTLRIYWWHLLTKEVTSNSPALIMFLQRTITVIQDACCLNNALINLDTKRIAPLVIAMRQKLLNSKLWSATGAQTLHKVTNKVGSIHTRRQNGDLTISGLTSKP